MKTSRLPAAAAVLLLHGALLGLAWSGLQPTGPATPATALAVRLLESSPPQPPLPLPAPPRAAAMLPTPALVALPLPELLGISPMPAAPVVPPVAPPVAAPASPALATLAFAAPAAGPRAEPPTVASLPAAEPVLAPARRAACAPAPHPPLLRERGIEGAVRLRVWVDELGRAGQVRLSQGSGFRLFDEAALAQASQCPYHPARRGDQAIGSWVEFTVRFALRRRDGRSSDDDA